MDNILENLKSNYEKYTNSQKKIARYIIENVNEVSYLRIDDLAREVGTNPSTIVRFSKEIGFMGYSHFRKSLEKIVMKKLQASGQYEKAKKMIRKDMENNVFYKSLANDLENLNSMFENIDKKKIVSCVDLIVSARKKYIISSRGTLSLGHVFYFRLRKILPNVFFINDFDGGIFDHIRELNKNDIVIAISFPRFSSNTLSFVRSARKFKAKIFSITSNQFSPLYKISDLCLFCPYEGISFFTSHVCTTAMISAIISEISIIKKDQVLNNLEIDEKILLENDVLKTELFEAKSKYLLRNDKKA